MIKSDTLQFDTTREAVLDGARALCVWRRSRDAELISGGAVARSADRCKLWAEATH